MVTGNARIEEDEYAMLEGEAAQLPQSSVEDEIATITSMLRQSMPLRVAGRNRIVTEKQKQMWTRLKEIYGPRNKELHALQREFDVTRHDLLVWKRQLESRDPSEQQELASLIAQLTIPKERKRGAHIPPDQRKLFLRVIDILSKRKDGSAKDFRESYHFHTDKLSAWRWELREENVLVSKGQSPKEIEKADAVTQNLTFETTEEQLPLFERLAQAKAVRPEFFRGVSDTLLRNFGEWEVQHALHAVRLHMEPDSIECIERILCSGEGAVENEFWREPDSDAYMVRSLMITAERYWQLQNKLVTSRTREHRFIREDDGVDHKDRLRMIHHLLEIASVTNQHALPAAMGVADEKGRMQLGSLWNVLWKGEEARETLRQGNLPLVRSIVGTDGKDGDEIEQDRQAGNLGLLRAIDSFDPQMGTAFSTHAEYWIRHCVQRRWGLSSQNTLYVPDHTSLFRRSFEQQRNAIESDRGQSVSQDEALDELGISEGDRETLRAASISTARLSSFEDDPTQSKIPQPDEILELKEEQQLQRRKVAELLRHLDKRTRRMFELKYLADDRELSDEEVAERMGEKVSHQRVNEIMHKEGFEKLRGKDVTPSLVPNYDHRESWDSEKLLPPPERDAVVDLDSFFDGKPGRARQLFASRKEDAPNQYPLWLEMLNESSATQLHSLLMDGLSPDRLGVFSQDTFVNDMVFERVADKNKAECHAKNLWRNGEKFLPANRKVLQQKVGKRIEAYDQHVITDLEYINRGFLRNMERKLVLIPHIDEILRRHFYRCRRARQNVGWNLGTGDENHSLIDLGAGEGHLLQGICQHFRRITAVERDTSSVGMLGKRASGRVQPIEADLRDFIREVSPFLYDVDVVVMSHMLTYFQYRATGTMRTGFSEKQDVEDEEILTWAHNALNNTGMMIGILNDMVTDNATRAHLHKMLPRGFSSEPFPPRYVDFLERRGCPVQVIRPTLHFQAESELGYAALREIVRMNLPGGMHHRDDLLDSYMERFIRNNKGNGLSEFRHRLYMFFAYKNGRLVEALNPDGRVDPGAQGVKQWYSTTPKTWCISRNISAEITALNPDDGRRWCRAVRQKEERGPQEESPQSSESTTA